MTYQQREEYTAPVCEVVTFEVEEEITVSALKRAPIFSAGFDTTQDDIDDEDW